MDMFETAVNAAVSNGIYMYIHIFIMLTIKILIIISYFEKIGD